MISEAATRPGDHARSPACRAAATTFAFLLGLSALLHGGLSIALERADHFLYGFDLDGAHNEVACESCHVRGVFKGTPRECGYCHDGTGIYASSFRSLSHPLTTENCQACHITANWDAVTNMDHAEVMGSCRSCHNGRVAEGLPMGHIQTTQECDACHNDLSWSGMLFDHAGITGGCSSCHDGVQATGKSPQHVPSTSACQDCHSVDFWTPAVTVDHAQILGSCGSCHDGIQTTGKHPQHIVSPNSCDDCHTTAAWLPAVFDHGSVSPGTCATCHDGITATGKHAQHLVTNASCDACHSTIAWLPATFDHDSVTPGSCATCHDGVTATGMNSGHFMTAASCDDCHTANFWTPDTFTHTSPAYPGDHRANLDCTDCHRTNTEQVTWTSPAFQPDCAGCHASDFRPGEHRKHEDPDVNYTAAELADCTGACHQYTDSTQSAISEFEPGPEHSVQSRDW